ncbi:ventral anterior homeobox 2a-like [Xenia sp. Carnegie-2017]|uniref:ventral anterior homeobox 2a-like n=1 Tax=Xenia sp. Carnegie-2017 TaxID=2897299 RepID=UPI001F043D1C|nr:ventral anterior homeobox 2a-like [Xenia sp. Carnegie-2017]
MEPQAKTFNSSRPSVIYFHGIRVKYIQDDKKTLSKEFENEESGDSNSAIPALTVKRTWMSDNGHDSKTETADAVCTENEEECLRKRRRTSFTSFQTTRLEEEFDHDNYIVGMKRWRLSKELDIPEKQIKIWFQNKRTKLKRNFSNDEHK